MQFFIAPVASWLRTRRFSEPTFRPSGATNHWKNTVFRDFPTFSRICIFFLPDSFSSDLLSSNLPLLSASALLCFSSVHIVGSLTSKLPSINYMHVLDMILKVIEMPKKRYVPIRTHPSACKALARCSSLISAWQGNNGGVILCLAFIGARCVHEVPPPSSSLQVAFSGLPCLPAICTMVCLILLVCTRTIFPTLGGKPPQW